MIPFPSFDPILVSLESMFCEFGSFAHSCNIFFLTVLPHEKEKESININYKNIMSKPTCEMGLYSPSFTAFLSHGERETGSEGGRSNSVPFRPACRPTARNVNKRLRVTAYNTVLLCWGAGYHHCALCGLVSGSWVLVRNSSPCSVGRT